MLENFRTQQEFIDSYSIGQKMRLKNEAVNKALAEIGGIEKLSTSKYRANKRKFNQNPIVPNMADYVNWVLYDRLVTAAGGTIPTNFKFFTVPIGTNGKTKVDTNMDQVQQLPQPYWMNATHIGFAFMPNTLLLDIVNFWSQAYFEFWVNNKIYVEGPYQVFPGGSGLHGTTTNTGTSALSSGIPLEQNNFDMRLPAGIHLGNDSTGAPVVTDGLTGITILQSQAFKVENNLPGGALTLTAAAATPNSGTGLILNVYLKGVLSRSVS
jgi:hypothetical protein